MRQPACVYINWAAYDELSDNVELTEELALRQLGELLRLREQGVRLDYYLMDAFWYAPDGGYRTWRQPHWPEGPDRWLDQCLQNGVAPGLWVATNALAQLDPVPEWRSSLDAGGGSCCLFHGGYLEHFLETLHLWYERGVRMYKLDFLNLDAAPRGLKETMLPSEIRAANASTLRGALAAFRRAHPELLLLAYNGFEEWGIQGDTVTPLRKAVDTRWLDAFDSLYCGDPRLADVPAMSFWRSKDIYSDHMVRYYEANGIPLSRIDNSAFMIGTTGTCYGRRTAAWKGMLLLSLARGGWMNTYYGNLDLLSDEDAAWFSRAQDLFLPFQSIGAVSTFGAMPGSGNPYGYTALEAGSGLITVVNPSQAVRRVELPENGPMRLLFRDAGFQAALREGGLLLGPEQMAVVGVGSYADADCDLGVQEDVVIPSALEPLPAEFVPEGGKAVSATVAAPSPEEATHLRVILRQTDGWGRAARSSGGSPPGGTPMDRILRLEAEQAGQSVPVRLHYDKAIWSGLSWAAGEIALSDLKAGEPVTLRLSTTEGGDVRLSGEVYRVTYR